MIRCACGCIQRFYPKSSTHVYATPACKRRVRKMRDNGTKSSPPPKITTVPCYGRESFGCRNSVINPDINGTDEYCSECQELIEQRKTRLMMKSLGKYREKLNTMSMRGNYYERPRHRVFL